MAEPRQPSYDLNRIFALRNKLCEDLVLTFSQEIGTVVLLKELTAVALRHLPPGIRERAVRDSLVDLLGKSLDRPLLYQVAWRLAGNVPRLKRNQAATPWLHQRQTEKSPAVIVHVERLTRENGSASARQRETGGMVTFEVQAGTQTGMRLRKWWSTRFASRHRQALGFARLSRRPDNLPPGKPFLGFEDIRQLAHLRLSLRFTQESCKDGLDFDGFVCPPAALEHNRKLLTLRARIEHPCPLGYTHSCHVCSVGQDQCRAACHPLTYTQKPCTGCQKQQAFFDPAIRREVCVECTARPPAEGRRT